MGKLLRFGKTLFLPPHVPFTRGGHGEGVCPWLVPNGGWSTLSPWSGWVPPPRQPGEHQPLGVTVFAGGGVKPQALGTALGVPPTPGTVTESQPHPSPAGSHGWGGGAIDLKIPIAARRGDPPPPAGGSWAQLSPETAGGTAPLVLSCPSLSPPQHDLSPPAGDTGAAPSPPVHPSTGTGRSGGVLRVGAGWHWGGVPNGVPFPASVSLLSPPRSCVFLQGGRTEHPWL